VASDLELSPAAVERLADWLATRAGDPDYEPIKGFRKREAHEALTAALRLDDPETVRRMARWINEHVSATTLRHAAEGKPHAEEAVARAAISALLGAEDE
jgi:hypothetical protein